MRLPRFVDRVAVKCVCNAPPHPLAYLALLPADQVLTPKQLRACRDVLRGAPPPVAA